MKFFLTGILLFGLSFHLTAQDIIDSLISEGNYLQALDEAKAIVSEDSLNANNWELLGKSYRLNLKYTDAIKAYEKAVELAPDNKSLLLTLAKTCNTAGNRSKAINIYKQILELDSANIAAQTNLALLYLKTGKFQDAYNLFYRLHLADTLNSEYVRQMGYCKYRSGEIVLAFELYKKSYRLNPENLKAIYWLADVYTNSNKPDSTIEMINMALKLYPENGRLYAKRGNAYFRKNHHYLSADDYKKALELGYSNYQLQKNLGKSLFAIKKYEESRDALEQLIVKDTADYQVCGYLGKIYYKFKDYKKSLLFYNHAVELLAPDSLSLSFTYRGMEETYHALGQYYKQISAIKKRFKYGKKYYGSETYLLEIAKIYENDLKNKKLAIKYYQKYYDLIKKIDNDDYRRNAEKTLSKINRLKEDLHFEQ